MSRNSVHPLFEIRRSAVHGKGAFALRRIRPGTRIIEYVGQRVSADEGDRRYPLNGHAHYHTFLFEVGKDVCIDAGVHGNDARFINHSCDPNCQAIEEEGRIFIEAIRNIQPGAELNYDYAMSGTMPRTKAERELYACRCGAANCRGIMLAPRKRANSARKARS